MTTERRRERGAVSTIVVLLMGMGVVFGALTIGVDVGSLLWERRQLQNGADAAALSLAAECGKGAASCTATAGDTAAFANRNAEDALSNVVSACQVNIGGSLPVCPTPVSALTQCPPLPANLASMTGLPYVEVRTSSQSSGGSFVSNWFAGISGGSNSRQSSVKACSRAAIGTASGGTAELPITFSGCDWQHATGGSAGGGGGSYYASPVYNGATSPDYGYGGAGQPGWPAAAVAPPAQLQGQEVILLAQNPPGGATPATPCPTWNGHALPGGFGTLETEPTDACKFVEYSHHWMHTSTGNNTGCNLANYVGKVISIPIFDCTNTTAPGVAPPVNGCTTGAGNNAFYHRAGFAQFYLSGYSVNVTGPIDNFRNSIRSGIRPCNNPNKCISGWFLSGELSATSLSGPPGGGGFFGSFAVVPAG